ncbi:MAG: carbohydrate ABC transporter permease [Bacillota bacterium]
MTLRLNKSNLVTHIILLTFAGLMIYPLLWLVSSSLKPNEEIFSTMGLIPSTIEWSNYVKGWTAMPRLPFSVFFRNSLFVATMAVIGEVLVASLVAFGFARMEFRLKKPLFALLLLTMMLPSQALLVPQYIVFKNLGWVGSYLPLVVPPFFGGAFFIFLMVQFMRGIPRDLDEAAKLDGCGPFQIYWRILMPLSQPALASVAIFSFLWTWNDFLHPVIYISDPKKFTIPLALRLFMDNSQAVSWGGMFAMSALSILPNLAIFLFFQKHFVEGITAGGLKG